MEPFILTENLVKDFRVVRRKPGLIGALRNLVRRDYDVVRAVDHVGFRIDAGETVGILGPNGAGKSTTIKMLTGILRPTSGIVRIDGRQPLKDRQWFTRQIGVVFGQRSQLWWDIPLRDSFELLKHIYGIPTDRYRSTLQRYGTLLDLDRLLPVPVRQLSLGQKMRAELCAAMLHEPRILFLDEPTIGLDIEVRERIHRAIKASNRQAGTTVILTTHDVSDIDSLCRRIVVISGGRVAYDGDIASAKAALKGKETLVCLIDDDAPDRPIDVPAHFQDLTITRDRKRLSVVFDNERINRAAVVEWLCSRFSVRHMMVNEVSTADLLRSIYRRSQDEAA